LVISANSRPLIASKLAPTKATQLFTCRSQLAGDPSRLLLLLLLLGRACSRTNATTPQVPADAS